MKIRPLSADEAGDAVEIEHGRHGAGQPLDGALHVEPLAEEEPVDHPLGARVDRVEEEHDGEGEHHRGASGLVPDPSRANTTSRAVMAPA